MIDFDKATGVFHLHNDKVSYVMQVVRDRYLCTVIGAVP